VRSVLADVRPTRRTTAEHHIAWWVDRLGTLSLAEITPDQIAEGRDALSSQPYTRGKPSKVEDGATVPVAYKRSGATVNRYRRDAISHVHDCREGMAADRQESRS
jgi:hypothetical protein